MKKEDYVEPMVADTKGNVYVSMKYHKEKIEQLQNNWNELKEYFKKEMFELEQFKEGISIDDYVDRKSFLREVLNKVEEIESRK